MGQVCIDLARLSLSSHLWCFSNGRLESGSVQGHRTGRWCPNVTTLALPLEAGRKSSRSPWCLFFGCFSDPFLLLKYSRHNRILVSGVVIQQLHTLQNAQHSKYSHHRSPRSVTTMFLTLFSTLYTLTPMMSAMSHGFGHLSSLPLVYAGGLEQSKIKGSFSGPDSK